MPNFILRGDCRLSLQALSPAIVRCCVTSPPYWRLRDYGDDRQIGLEETPEQYVAELVKVFREVKRVLTEDGTLWLNLGDCFAGPMGGGQGQNGQCAGRAADNVRLMPRKTPPGLKPKDLVGIPWRVALALQADGWWLRSDVVWAKPNAMPESVADRPTRAHEYVFLLSKSERYYYDAGAISEPAVAGHQGTLVPSARDLEKHPDVGRGARQARYSRRNARSVWTLPTQPFHGTHFAVMPPKLAERCILAGSAIGDAVLDPFFGTGTVGQVATSLGRRWVGCELVEEYADLAMGRTAQAGLPWRAE